MSVCLYVIAPSTSDWLLGMTSGLLCRFVVTQQNYVCVQIYLPLCVCVCVRLITAQFRKLTIFS